MQVAGEDTGFRKEYSQFERLVDLCGLLTVPPPAQDVVPGGQGGRHLGGEGRLLGSSWWKDVWGRGVNDHLEGVHYLEAVRSPHPRAEAGTVYLHSYHCYLANNNIT